MKNEEQIDYLEHCDECGEFFEKSEMKEIDGNFYCRDCSHRCVECNEMLSGDIDPYNKSFCSRNCYNVWYGDMYEEDWKEANRNDNLDEY